MHDRYSTTAPMHGEAVYDDRPEPVPGRVAAPAAYPAVQRRRAGAGADEPDDPEVHGAAARGVATPATRLPFADVIQRAFGRHDISSVQAHRGGDATASARAIGASAYAAGNHVVLGDGDDLFTVAHEAAHVVQQRGGVQLRGGVGAHGDAYEQHADAVAQRVVRGESAEALLDQHAGGAAPVAASAAPAVQRAVLPVAAKRVRGSDMLAMTLGALEHYARSQLDWHVNPEVSPQQHDDLRTLLEIAEAEPSFSSACREMAAVTLVPRLANPDDRRRLLCYAGAVARARRTVKLERTNDAGKAVQWGAMLEALEAGLPGGLLEQIFRHDVFVELVDGELGGDFVVPAAAALIAYANTDPRPTLHCDTGAEIRSILGFLRRASLADYQGKVPHIRNVHRFYPDILRRLQDNWATRPAPHDRRLTVFVHSTFDDKGAFHRDNDLADVVEAGSNFVLVIEGKASLGEIQGVIEEIGREFGPIAQVMFAGHGSARGTQMAGNLEDREGRLVPNRAEDIDLDDTPGKTGALIDATIANMADGGRMVFNACLSDSNRVDPDHVNDDKGLHDQLTAHRSLAQHTRDRAIDLGKPLEVKGANGSFSRTKLMDDDERLDLVSERDRALTAGKPIYAQHGMDPTGAMRALLETWASDRKAALDIAHARMSGGDTSWSGSVIEALYALVVQAYAAKPKEIAELAFAAGRLKDIEHADTAEADRIRRMLTYDEWKVIWPRLAKSDAFVAHVPLVVHQVTTLFSVTGEVPFLAAAGTFTAASISDDPLVKLDALEQRGALKDLLAVGSGTEPGRLVLAILALLHDSTSALARAFLHPLGHPGGFTVDIHRALGGLRTERQVLELVGHGEPDMETDDVDANLDVDRDDTNDSYARPMFARGTNPQLADYVTTPPTGAALEDDDMELGFSVPPNSNLAIVGRYTDPVGGTWYCIEVSGGVGYIRTAAVTVV